MGSPKTCISVTKKCNEFKEKSECPYLDAGAAGKRCVFIDNKCEEHYDVCSAVQDNTKCNSNIPKTRNEQCVLESNVCTTKTRNCDNYKKFIDYYNINYENSYLCSLLNGGDNKVCIWKGEQCKALYTSCSSGDANNCAAITLNDNLYYCSYNSTSQQCEKKKRKCKDYKSEEGESVCTSLEPENSNKICIYDSKIGKCIENYDECEKYNDETTKKAEDCESIQPDYRIYPYYDYKYKCVFRQNSCQKQKLGCEDYEGQDESDCRSISQNLDDSSTFECKFIDGKCKKDYKYCYSYKGNEKTVCESIVFENYKCIFENDECTEDNYNRLCSNYQGNDPYICGFQYYSSKTGYICALVNNKCIEQEGYHYCGGYEGKDKDKCESIKIYGGLSYSMYKCVLTKEGCEEKLKGCSDTKDESECSDINISNYFFSKKQCVYINNTCVEQFKTCEDYNKEDTIDKDTCESILIQDNTKGHNYQNYKCVYNEPPSGQNKGTCIEETRKCEDFNIDFIQNKCTSLSSFLDDKNKKCVYNSSNKSCSLKSKTCLDFLSYSDATEEICNKAEVSNTNKVCIKYSAGCYEADKHSNDNSNDSAIQKLSKIIFVLFYLLF